MATSIYHLEPTRREARTKSVIRKHLKYLSLLIVCVVLAAPASAQKRGRRAADPLVAEYAKQRENLEAAVAKYKSSLDDLIVSLVPREAAAAARSARLRDLLAEGVVSRKEVEDAEREHATVMADISKARLELEQADVILHEAKAAEQIALTPPSRSGAYVSTAAVIRYGGARWAIQDIGKVQSFFASRFGRSLPISSFGQSPLHNRLGFDHRSAVDIPVHPDSAEGKAVLAYLRSAGIPFLAFRGAVAGKSTGAHIHIGFPSSRFR